MRDIENAVPTTSKRLPWNKGKLTGANLPLRPKHVWSIRTKLQVEGTWRCSIWPSTAAPGPVRRHFPLRRRDLRRNSTLNNTA